jgi:L-fuculose-phosphate aldolase
VTGTGRLPQRQNNGAGWHGGSVTFRPIGYVRNNLSRTDRAGPCDGVPSDIVLLDSFAKGIEGLEPGQEIIVLFWFHCSNGYELLQHPQGDRSRPKRGVFALRSPNRPNPIGETRTEIIGLNDCVISLASLDAFDGTPVLDIKPVNRERRIRTPG